MQVYAFVLVVVTLAVVSIQPTSSRRHCWCRSYVQHTDVVVHTTTWSYCNSFWGCGCSKAIRECRGHCSYYGNKFAGIEGCKKLHAANKLPSGTNRFQIIIGAKSSSCSNMDSLVGNHFCCKKLDLIEYYVGLGVPSAVAEQIVRDVHKGERYKIKAC